MRSIFYVLIIELIGNLVLHVYLFILQLPPYTRVHDPIAPGPSRTGGITSALRRLHFMQQRGGSAGLCYDSSAGGVGGYWVMYCRKGVVRGERA
jgi:hypothetical protein